MISRSERWLRQWSLERVSRQLRVASAYIHHNYSAGVVMLAANKGALRSLRLSRRIWGRFARAVIEVVIGDVIIRAGVDADEAHLRRVIRAVRSG